MTSTRTVLPAANEVPSTVETLIRSFDSSKWKSPDVPSAHVPLMIGGKIVGAIGVSGGTGSQDDTVSQAGVAALK